MGKRKREPIEYDTHVKPISDDPLNLSLRLDFADWLEKNGHIQRAGWIRLCCGDCQYIRDILASFSQATWSTINCFRADPLEFSRKRLEQIRPPYIPNPPLGTGSIDIHFGRLVIREIGDFSWICNDWVTKANHEGWIELLYFCPSDDQCFATLVRKCEDIPHIPVMLDATRTLWHTRPTNHYQNILRSALLHGLVVCNHDLGMPGFKNLANNAKNLRYLHLLSLTKSVNSQMILEQLAFMPELVSLVIGTSHPSDETIHHLVAAKKLRALGLYGKRLSDKGLMEVCEMQSLRYLGLNVPNVSRNAVEELGRNRPDLIIHIHGDMRYRIGPVMASRL